MGIFDKAKDLIGQHNDKIDQGIDKAADFIDSKTGGSHGSKIDQGAASLKDRLDEFSGRETETAPAPDPVAEPPATNQPPTAPPVS